LAKCIITPYGTLNSGCLGL